MKTRHSAISPFIATVMLIVITLVIGGTLFGEFRQTVVSEMRNPSVTLEGVNVAPDGQTITLTVKNDGNVQVSLQGFSVVYSSSKNFFELAGSTKNATVLSSPAGGDVLQPGDLLTAQVKSTFSIPSFSSFTVTVIGDQVARAFNVQA